MSSTAHNNKDNETREMIRLRADGLTNKQVGEKFGISGDSVSQRITRYNKRQQAQAERSGVDVETVEAMHREAANTPTPTISPVTTVHDIDGADVWERAIRVSKRKITKKEYTISFDNAPVCIVQSGDWHIGSSGVDYERLHEEIQLVRDTDGMYFGLIGDIADNMIVGRLAHIRAVGGEFTMTEEWAMVKHALSIAGDKVLYSIAGNHDLWSETAGLDQLKQIHDMVNTEALYHKYDMPINIIVNGHKTVLRARHNWRGHSQYNDTHAIEKAGKFDKGSHFDIGVGGHTHRSGLCREFNNGGETGLAILCGAYKRYDPYAQKLGFPSANEGTAVAVVFEADGSFWGTSNLHAAARYMRTMYGD